MIKLEIYEESLTLIQNIHTILKSEKLKRQFIIQDQLLRAAISIPANLSEGYMRTKAVFKNHLNIAIGSCNEVITLLEVVQQLYEINTSEVSSRYEILARRMTAFKNRLK